MLWNEEFKKKRQDFTSGAITEEQFRTWLEETKKYEG
jgi:hypothetical protein